MPRHIVIVDSSMTMGRIVGELLDSIGIGWTYELSSNADEALQKMRDARPALVMLDTEVPDSVDGVVIAQAMRDSEDLNRIPIILMSLDDKFMESTLEAADGIYFWRKERSTLRLSTILKAIFPEDSIPLR